MVARKLTSFSSSIFAVQTAAHPKLETICVSQDAWWEKHSLHVHRKWQTIAQTITSQYSIQPGNVCLAAYLKEPISISVTLRNGVR